MKKSTKKTFFSILITLLAVAAVSATDGLVSAAVACSYYASPNGGGNGLSQSSPFKIANFWKVASPWKNPLFVGWSIFGRDYSTPKLKWNCICQNYDSRFKRW